MEKAALKWTRKKMQNKIKTIWNFIKSQVARSSTTPPEFNHDEDVADDDTADKGDD